MTDGRGLSRRELLRRGVGGAALLGAGPALLAACGSEEDAGADAVGARPGTPARGGTLRAAFPSAPSDVLDPLNIADILGAQRVRQVCEPLAVIAIDGRVEMLVAESIEPNRDGSEWTVRVREGVEFHDGRPLRADDVLASLTRAKRSPEIGSRVGPLDAKRSRRLDARTVRLGLPQPPGDFDEMLANPYLPIIPAAATRFASARDLVGTGPFRAAEVTLGKRTVLERNDAYWNAGDGGGPYLDRLELVAIGEPAARMRALRAGQIQLASDVSFADADAQRSNRELQLVPSKRPASLGWFMSAAAGTVDDPRARLALKHAVDREALVRSVTYGFGKVGNDLWGAGWPGYPTDVSQREHDPERARSLLAEADRDGAALTIASADFQPGIVESSTLVTRQLEQLGLRAEGNRMPGDSYFADIQNVLATNQLVGFGFNGDFATFAPIALLTKSPFNYGWKRPDWERRYFQARATLDRRRREELLGALQRELWEDGYDIVWGQAPTITAASAAVRGLRADEPQPFQASFRDVGLAS